MNYPLPSPFTIAATARGIHPDPAQPFSSMEVTVEQRPGWVIAQLSIGRGLVLWSGKNVPSQVTDELVKARLDELLGKDPNAVLSKLF